VADSEGPLEFSHEVVDNNGPTEPWGKTVGDINGDGLLDIIVGGHVVSDSGFPDYILNKLGLSSRHSKEGLLVWYENPSWSPKLISHEFRIRTDVEIGDINQDGRNDVIIVADSGLYWLENPTWITHKIIDDLVLHDLELSDLDSDGKLDIVARDQSRFGHDSGDILHIFRQTDPQNWSHLKVGIDPGEGLKITDLNNDSKPDIVVNRYWLQNSGTLANVKRWQRFDYATDWDWDDVYIDSGDLNGDGQLDLVLSPAEEAGEYYQIAWFQAPTDHKGQWIKHIVDKRVEAVHHFVAARDIDRDGRVDIISAEMHQSQDPDEVKVYLNTDRGWQKQVIANQGSHNMRAVDIDNDLDIDLIGANWRSADGGPVRIQLWRNSLSENIHWVRHEVDSQRPGQATFIYSEDIDGDSRKDIVTGGFWYQQPLRLGGKWQRRALGRHANNVMTLSDFDGDGDIDFLASGWISYDHSANLVDRAFNRLGIKEFDYEQPGGRFVWGENDGGGEFQVHENLEPSSGDFLQGQGAIVIGGVTYILLSWHDKEPALETLEVPDDPVGKLWRLSRIYPDSQREALSIADIDRDGQDDVVMGTRWLQSIGNNQWKVNLIDKTLSEPDRNQVADINQDGRLDVVIGFQAISTEGKLAWYEQPPKVEGPWTEHRIADDIVGPMSLSVADMDKDGDWDVVVGEHNIQRPELARLLWLENRIDETLDWQKHLIHQGDEHHDGAVAVDIDGDGDMDILSIGWSHGKVLVYENTGIQQ
jgi:hypothetical protein